MLTSVTQSEFSILEMQHGKVNAMDLEFCEALIKAIKAFEESDSTCLVIRSTTANRVFSAGIDLKRLTAEPPSYTREYFPALIQLFEQVYFCSKPTLAVIEGVAIAGGCVMAVACAARIGTGSAAFGMPNKKLDVPIPQIAPVILNSELPEPIAKSLHSESLYSAEEARECQLLSRLVEEDQLEQHIAIQARELASSAFVPNVRSPELLQSFQAADSEMIEAWCTDELRQRISKYVHSL
jgi:enoyl-CoA hydratase